MGSRFIILGVAVACLRAQSPTSISDLGACINDKLVNQGNVDISAAVDKCMPQGCKITASMSTASAQPACTIASTQLPRVYFNCPGPAAGLRFRPTFTLCPNDANRIEVGEDVAPIAPNSAVPMKMGNIEIPMGQPIPHELASYLSTANNNLRCTRCHGNAQPGLSGDTPLLSSPFDPFTTTRRNLLPFVIYTTEPARKAIVSPAGAAKRQTIDEICAQIRSTLDTNPFAYGFSAPIPALCESLAKYAAKKSCGNGVENVRCSGIVGGGIFTQNGVSTTIALEFSGQASYDPDSPERSKFKDIDGSLTAPNINAVFLSSMELTAADDGSFAIAAEGKAWINGVPAPVALRISYDKANETSRIAITNLESGDFYGGGTAAGIRFTVL